MQQEPSYRPRQEKAARANNGFTAEQAQALIARHLATRTPKAFDGRCPYVGPVPFGEADARLYFGRENLIDDLLDRAERSRFIAVVGPESVGKTSLIDAGLLFGLRNGALMDSDKWLIHRFTPGDDPLGKLAEACAALGERAGLATVMTDAIKKRGLTGPNALNDLVDMLLGPDKSRRAVLIVDQFEEAFTKAKNVADAHAFITFLTQAVQNVNSRALIVIALRSEFLASCDNYPELKALVDKFKVRLAVMDDAELARSIVLPALETGTKIEPQLVSRLVADVQGDPTMLPKLQLALRDLFMALPSQRGTDKVLRLIDYIDLGPIRQREEDRPPEAEAAAETILHLPKPLRQRVGETRAVSHFARQEAQMRRMKVGTTIAGIVAAGFVLAGLVGVVTGNAANQRAQLAATAEALAYADATRSAHTANESDNARATAQVQSTQAAQARAEAIATRTAAEAAATKAVEDRSAALNDKASAVDTANGVKATAEALATRAVVEVNRGVLAQATANALATASVSQSQQAIAAGAAQAQQAIATRDAVALDLKSTRAREWAALAVNQLSSEPKLALLIALEAERLQHSQQSEDAIRRAFVAAFPNEGLFKVGSPVNAARFSPDGKLLVTASRDGRVKLWDIASREVLTSILAHVGAVNAAVFSKDGTQLVTGGVDRTVRVWDAATGKSVVVLSGHTGAVNSVDFSPDGKLVVSGSADKTARVWDVAAGKMMTAPIQATGVISGIRFAGNDEILVDGEVGETGLQDWNWRTGKFEKVQLTEPPIGAVTNWDVSQPNTPRASIYDLPSDILLLGHAQPPTQIWLSPDMKLVATTSSDNSVRLHEVYLDQLAARAQELLGRELTCDERARYLSEKADCTAAPTATPAK